MSKIIKIDDPNDLASIKILADKIINNLTNLKEDFKHNKMNLVCSIILIKKQQSLNSTKHDYDNYLLILNSLVNKKIMGVDGGSHPVLIQYTNFQTFNNSPIQFVMEIETALTKIQQEE